MWAAWTWFFFWMQLGYLRATQPSLGRAGGSGRQATSSQARNHSPALQRSAAHRVLPWPKNHLSRKQRAEGKFYCHLQQLLWKEAALEVATRLSSEAWPKLARSEDEPMRLLQHRLAIPEQWSHLSCVRKANIYCLQPQGQTHGLHWTRLEDCDR